MKDVIEKIYRKTIEDLKKAGKLPYPLYYQEVFNQFSISEGIFDKINPKLLCLEDKQTERVIEDTIETINFVNESSQEIKKDSETLVDELEVVDSDEVKELVIKFSANLITKINNMEKRIEELQSELNKAYEELLIEPLTKVYNRKALEKDLKELVNQKRKFILALIDVDNFKEVNDQYGHLVGDFVLIKLVSKIKEVMKSAKIYRYGGDEFVLIFEGVDFDIVASKLEQLIKKIGKTTLKYKENFIKITISCGIAEFEGNESYDEILKKADDALYQAKKCKNCLVKFKE